MVSNKLTYPEMRKELIDYISALSDIEYQQKIWIEKQYPNEKFYDELDYTIHFLYDDTDLATNPYAWIGLVLLNEEEAEGIRKVISVLDEIFLKYGLNLSDKEYIQLKEWDNVIESAKALMRLWHV